MPADADPLPVALTVLSVTRHQRFEATGRLNDLNEAVTLGEQAVATTSSSDPNLVGRLSNLGGPSSTVTGTSAHRHNGRPRPRG